MSVVQMVTLWLALATVVIILVFILRCRGGDMTSALKSTILLTVVVHISLFYLCEHLVFSMGWQKLYLLLQDIFDTRTAFSAWSASLRLHTVLAILTKEAVAILARRARMVG